MKKDLKTIFKKIGLSLGAAAAAFVWSTCDVGLGEAVDTMAPSVSVTSPAASSVCAKAVKIEGTCSDDKGISSVKIVVTNTKTGAKYNYYAEIKDQKNWTKTINELVENSGYPLPDGSYTADVVATDVFGRSSGTSSTAFDIDNTEPIFCVTSPSSLDISDPRKYGRSVSVSGEIADDHAIAKMEIRVFRTDASGTSCVEITDKLAKKEFKDFETAGGTTVYIAKYFDAEPAATNADGSENPDYKLYKNYMAIYDGVTLGQDVFIYVVPTLTDIAGNTSKQSYASTEMKKIIAASCGVETTIDSLQTAQLMKIYNGTYNLKELNQEQRTKVLSIMKGTYALQPGDKPYYCYYDDEDATKRSPLAATVNSNNSPRYSFNGYEFNPADINWSEINTGGTLSISVQAGLDDWGVLPKTIKAIISRCDDTGVIYGPGDPLRKVYVSGEDEGFDITNSLGEPISGISTSVTAQSYYVTLPKLSSGQYYVIEAEGKDEDENNLCGLYEKYAFKVSATGAAPKFDLNDRYYIKGASVLPSGSETVEIKITDGTDTINDGDSEHYVEVRRKLYNEHISSKGYLGNYSANLVNTASDTFRTEIVKQDTNSYVLTLPINKYSESLLVAGNYTLALELKAKNASTTTETTYILWIDNQKPLVSISAPEADNEKIYDNNANIKKLKQTDDSYRYFYTPFGKWSDIKGAGTSALWYTITDTSAVAPTISGNPTDGWTISDNSWIRVNAVQAETETSWEQEYAVAESTGNFIKMIAVDSVGNVSDLVKKSGITFDFGLPSIELAAAPGSTTPPITVAQYYNTYSPKNADGKLEFKLSAKDSLALAAADCIIVSAKKYDKTLNGGAGGYAAKNSGNDGYELGPIVYSADKKSASVVLTLMADGTSDGNWSFTATAIDACGRTSAEISFATIVDCIKPQLVDYDSTSVPAKPIVIKGAGLVSDWYKDDTLGVSGKFNEDKKAGTNGVESGVDKVYYWLETPSMQKDAVAVPSDLTIEGNYSGYVAIASDANTGSGVVYTIAPAGFEQIIVEPTATYYNDLYMQTIDKAGNKSDRIGPFQIKEDRDEPLFEAKYYTYTGGSYSPANGTAVSNGKHNMVLYGTVSDALSGVGELKFAIGSAEKTLAIQFTVDAIDPADDGAAFAGKNYADYASIVDKTKITGWKAEIAKGDLTTESLYGKAGDKAGNFTSNHKLFDIDIDKDSPELTLSTPETNLYASAYVEGGTAKTGGNPSGAGAAVNGEISIGGTASDSNLQSVSVYVGTDNSADIVAGDKLLANLSDTNMYNWSASNKFSYIEDGVFKFSDGSLYAGSGKTIYIKVKAVDSAENARINVYNYSVDPRSDRPALKLFKPLNSMTSADADYKWVTNDTTISGSISDDDGVKEMTATYRLYDSKTATWAEPVAATVSLSNGSFSVSGLKDGKQIITFTVKDNAGTTFTSHNNETSSYIAPLIQGSDDTPTIYGEAADGDTLVYIKVDNSLPITRDIGFSYYDAKAATPAYVDFSDSLLTLGGARNKLKIQFFAFDENGIDSVKLSMTDESEPPITQEIDGVVDTVLESDGYVRCSINDIQINDAKKLKSGTWPATIVITDKAGLKSTTTINITVDNDAPALDIRSPDSEQSVSGKVTAYGSVDKANVSYAIGVNDTDEPASSKWKDIESSLSWYIYFDGDKLVKDHDITLTQYLLDLGLITQGQIDDGTASVTSLYIWMKAVDEVGNESLKKFEVKADPLGDKPTVAINGPSTDGTTVGGKIRVYGSAKDDQEVKAVFVQIISVYHDTAIKPSGSYGRFPGDGKTPAVTEFTLTKDDLNYLAAVKDADNKPVYKIYKMATYDPEKSSTWTAWTGADGQDPKDYGVLTNLNEVGTSWNIYINDKAEFANLSATNNVAVKAFAIDAVVEKTGGTKSANISLGALRTMTFDANAPTISEAYIRKYDSASPSLAPSAVFKSSDSYKEDMFVKGQTWISFTLHDDSAIAGVEIGVSHAGESAAVSAKKSAALPTAIDTDTRNTDGDIVCYSPSTVDGKDASLNQYVHVLAKLDTASGVGTQYVYVEFKDTTGAPALAKYTIKYDNTAPALAPVTDEDDYLIDPSVRQDNGWYRFGSKVSEDDVLTTKQSGFKRVAFYFMRRDTTKTGTPTYIYDPMIKKGAAGNKIDYSDGLEYSEGLYWKKISITRTAAEDTVTLAAEDKNIHPYGLAKIGGTIYTISSVSGTTVVVDGRPEGTSGTVEDAYFAIGNVVDHILAESHAGHDLNKEGYLYGYNEPSSDDGDYMVESVKQNDTKWTWSASIYSKNIPDGPIELHYVAFDAAGNYAKGLVGCVAEATYKAYTTKDAVDAAKASPEAPVKVYAYAETDGSLIYTSDKAAFVSNNAPRLASIFAGTDLDGDDVVSAAEMTAFTDKDSITDWNQAKSAMSLGSKTDVKLTAKGRTIVRPEILGGNGDLYYSYKISSGNYNVGTNGANATGYIISGQNNNVFMASDTGDAQSREDQVKGATADITLQVGDFINLPHDGVDYTANPNASKGIEDCDASSPALFEFTFWDSTDVSQKFVNSQTAKASVYMAVALRDSEVPTVDIEPVYWKSLTDNSTYQAKSASTYAGLKGHIELPKDLESTSDWTSPFTATSGEMDKDPKLSGVIVLKGSLSDNKMLSKVFMSVTNGTDGMDKAGGSFDKVKVAAADTTHCKTGGTTPSAVTAYPLAKYAAGTWTVADNLAEYGVKFEISDSAVSETDHTASWTMVWDTSFVSGLAATDLAIRIFACDQVSTAGTWTAGEKCLGVDGATNYNKPAFSDNKFSAGSDTPTESQKDVEGNPKKTPYYKVDVVPYITGLETIMTKKGDAYGRTSTGRYPVYFYKNSSTSDTAMTYGLSEGQVQEGDAKGFTVNGFNLAAKNASVTKTIGDTGADITASVNYVITVNGVKTLNNQNNDDAHGDYSKPVDKKDWNNNTNATYNAWKNYTNRQPSKENNLLLTDDVEIDVWQLNNKAAVPVRGIANDVTMKINQESKMLNFAFVSGPLNFAMPNTSTNSYQTWARSYDFCKSATLALDDGGNAYGTIAGGDTGENYADAFGFYSSKWGTGNLNNNHGTQTGTNQNRLESVGQAGSKTMTKETTSEGVTKYTNTDNDTGNQTDQWRIVSPCIATTYSSGTTNAYLAYYDQMNDEIRFRAGTSVPATKGDFGNFVDKGHADKDGDTGGNYKDKEYSFEYSYVQIVAQENTPKKPGPYVSIAAYKFTSGDVVVMVWHDPTARKMWYSFNEDPTKSRANTINDQTGRKGADGKRVHGWSEPVEVFSGVTGEYCQVAFDKEGKVHIAAKDSSSNDLWYAYLASYKEPADAKTCLVDSYGTVGSHITLDVAYSAGTSGKPVPYIGYLAEGKTLPKLAYYIGNDITSDNDISGAKGDFFTRSWEVQTVPSITKGIQGVQGYDRINVGVWKNNGVIANSRNGVSYYKQSLNEGDTGTYGIVYGNGSANPALAYRYEVGSNGYVEMAQKK